MREKEKTLDKESKNLQFKKLFKKQKLQERGITLIALVVTIIILLILAGVTLNIALSDNGLFSKAKKAAEDYKEAQSDEEDSIRQISTQLYSEYIGATVEGYSPANNVKEVKIDGETSGVGNNNDDGNGNTIDGVEINGSQTFKADEGMNWRVWDFDGNTLRIIGDPTTQKLTLKGAAGYNNGVWAIEKICRELYSNEDKGAIATSLKRTDIQKVSTYDYTKYKHEKNNGMWEEITDNSKEDIELIYFGESKTYENTKYPAMWSENDSNWKYEYSKDNVSTGEDKECKKWEDVGEQMGSKIYSKEDRATFKQSYYAHFYTKVEFTNEKYFNLIFKRADEERNTGIYWIEGRNVSLYNDYCSFGISNVSGRDDQKSVGGNKLFRSDGEETCIDRTMRPMVSINLKESGYELEVERRKWWSGESV